MLIIFVKQMNGFMNIKIERSINLKRKIVLAFLLVIFLLSGNSWGSPLAVGDIITFAPGIGTTNGGPFKTYKDGNYLFDTFCLERNEYMYYSGAAQFKIYGIDSYANAGGSGGQTEPGKDYLSKEAKWLYYNFTMGTLGAKVNGFSYNTDGANALQYAIWSLEGEGYGGNYLSNAAALAISAKDTAGIDSIMALNIAWDTNSLGYIVGTKAQSMIYNANPVPEPASMMLFGTGCVVFGGYLRRKLKK